MECNHDAVGILHVNKNITYHDSCVYYLEKYFEQNGLYIGFTYSNARPLLLLTPISSDFTFQIILLVSLEYLNLQNQILFMINYLSLI